MVSFRNRGIATEFLTTSKRTARVQPSSWMIGSEGKSGSYCSFPRLAVRGASRALANWS
jgi:hypothetical protein